MGGFDRSKFKAAPMSAINEQEKHQQTVRPSGQSNNETHDLKKNGIYWFRIAPFHPDAGGQSPFESKCITFLDVKVPKRGEDKKLIEGQFEIKAKPIFNARVHGGYPIDIVEEYMKVAKDVAIPAFTSDTEVQKKIWTKVSGFDQVKKKSGVKPQDTWICYAWDKSGKFATLELKKSIKDQLTELAHGLSKDVATPDPYSDPEDGIAILIEKTGELINTSYKVSLDKEQVDKFNTKLIPTPLTDAQLEELDKATPLYKRFVNSFTRKDLEYQVEGLENFDKYLTADGCNIGVFQYDQFLDAVEKMYDLVPESDGKGEHKEEQKPKQVEAPKPQSIRKSVPVETTTPTAASKFKRATQVVQTVDVEPQEELIPNEPLAPHLATVADKMAALRKKMGR